MIQVGTCLWQKAVWPSGSVEARLSLSTDFFSQLGLYNVYTRPELTCLTLAVTIYSINVKAGLAPLAI